MQSRLPFMIGLIVFEVIADVGAKTFELTNSYWWYAGALVAYVLGNALRLFAMKQGVGLGRGTIIFGVVTTLITLCIAYIYYREPVSTANLIGIALCVVGLVLVEL